LLSFTIRAVAAENLEYFQFDQSDQFVKFHVMTAALWFLLVSLLSIQTVHGFATKNVNRFGAGKSLLRRWQNSAHIVAAVSDSLCPTPTTLLPAFQERTFVALKPDAYERRLVGDVLMRLEKKGFRLLGLKLIPVASLNDIQRHYEEHIGKPFYSSLVDFFSSGPLVAMVWEGPNSVAVIRKLVGATHPEDASPGTIRGDLCFRRGYNLVHCSDSVVSAEREIGIWFPYAGNEMLSRSEITPVG
jgi:nucleoside-diphosphate kinase